MKKIFLQKSKRCRDGWMKLLANKLHIQGMEVLLADKVHNKKNHNINGTVSHNHMHPYISSSGMADA